MPEPTQDTPETQAWHKRFAKECNNLAWALSTQARTPQHDREMLDAAHASAWHWDKVGTDLNRMRATMLLAEVHALLGQGALALSLARQMRDFFLGKDDTPDWEVAFVHAVHAHAAAVAGQAQEHRSAHAAATQALVAIANPADRAIVAATFDHVPVP